jgi:uncharacterized protein YndB with AHSA1/START domain
MVAIKQYLLIKSPTGKVYQALTTRDGISNWWTEQTEIGKKVGDMNVFDFGSRYHNEMKITDLQPNKRAEWECIEGDKEWIGTTFIFDLEEKEGDTILRFTHGNWKEETDFFASCNYNWGYYMKSLAKYCEEGKGTPFREEDFA